MIFQVEAGEEVLGFVLLMAVTLIALVFYIILPTIALYKISKKFNRKQRIVTFLGYFFLFSLIVIEFLAIAAMHGYGTAPKPLLYATYLLLSIPITYPLCIGIIGIVINKRKQNTDLP
jgi:hypothetical protein